MYPFSSHSISTLHFSNNRSNTSIDQRSKKGQFDNVSTSPSSKPTSSPISSSEFTARIVGAGFCNSLTTTAAIWRNLNVLNPGSKVSLLELYKNRILQQTVMKSLQLSVFVQLQNFLSKQLPKDKQGLATAIAYPLVSIHSQGVIYTNLVQGYFQISGVPQKPVTLAAEIKKILVAYKPTAGRELGSTGLGMALAPVVKDYLNEFLPAEISGPLAPLLSGSLCGLMTQGLHNLALTESSMAGKNETPSTLGAFRILQKEHGWKSLINGSTGRIPNIAAGVFINNFFLQALKETGGRN